MGHQTKGKWSWVKVCNLGVVDLFSSLFVPSCLVLLLFLLLLLVLLLFCQTCLSSSLTAPFSFLLLCRFRLKFTSCRVRCKGASLCLERRRDFDYCTQYPNQRMFWFLNFWLIGGVRGLGERELKYKGPAAGGILLGFVGSRRKEF